MELRWLDIFLMSLYGPLDNAETEERVGDVLLVFGGQIVPTQYHFLNGEIMPTNQFSVTEYFQGAKAYDRSYPGTLKFFYMLNE